METLSLEMATYSKYKNSGFEWIGEIPIHWKVEKGKWLFQKENRLPLEGDGIVTAFRDGQVTLRSNRREDGFTNAIQEHGYQRIKKGDLVIHAMDAFAGAIGVSDSDGKSSPVYAACTPRQKETVDAYYYAYLLRNLAKTGFIESLAKGIRERSTDFRYKDFGLLELPLPPLPEQTAIANFLNKKTEQIDQAIAQKERLIELLKERRQILIHKAVTRGLNPDVKMKDSGVEWIGEVPEHWKVSALSYVARIETGSTPDRTRPTYWGGDIPWVKTGEVNYTTIRTTEEKITEQGLKNSATRLAEPETILMAMYGQGVTRGRVAILGVHAAYNQACCAIKFDHRIKHKFGYYFFIAAYPHVRDAGNETSQMNLSSGYISKLKVPIPTKSEQEEIISFIEFCNLKADSAIIIKTKEIDKLKEYKATLINAVVTGKIKVSA
ncbi:restriction endonuclease subunit S [Desertivirga brevis]|uniref:restriction endonuclease subunit S n=1 Tax=Desertivirga brevis TaxID=2810310 RepID=UPI001A964D1D|nr:restriction endonuclease subunit S [Pedobacter sp. SYSU D00873]